MQPILTQEFVLRSCNCDMQGRWKPSDVLVAMQEAAGAHSELFGMGTRETHEKGIFWVVSRIALEFDAYPMMGDAVRITTWPGVANRLMCPRYFTFEAEGGRPLGRASTLWMLLDLDKHTLAPVSRLERDFPDTAGLGEALPLPGRIRKPDAPCASATRQAVLSDCDINRHVNNTRYADWVCDRLPIARFEHECLRRLHINYQTEVLPATRVALDLYEDGDAFTLLGHGEGGKPTYFEAEGAFMPWNGTPVTPGR